MQTELPGLLVARRSGRRLQTAPTGCPATTITEALVFGRQAGRTAAARAKAVRTVPARLDAARDAIGLIAGAGPKDQPNSAELLQRLQAVMSDDVGPLARPRRTGAGAWRHR